MDDFEVTEADKRIWERAYVEAGYAPLRDYAERYGTKTNELNQGALGKACAALGVGVHSDEGMDIQLAVRAYLAVLPATAPEQWRPKVRWDDCGRAWIGKIQIGSATNRADGTCATSFSMELLNGGHVVFRDHPDEPSARAAVVRAATEALMEG